MKFYNNQNINAQRQDHPSISWKANTNNIIVAKNIKNDLPTNSKSCKSGEVCNLRDSKFKANPIKHYRKQYMFTNSNSYSNNSFIGVLDKPGNYIVTPANNNNCDENNKLNMSIHLFKNSDGTVSSDDKFYDSSLNRMICVACNPQSMIKKPATTVLDDEYCSSNKEYLNKKCKTYDQNLPSRNINTSIKDCYRTNNKCNTTFNPSNKKYQVQGPVTSSTRIAALKYGCNNKVITNCLAQDIPDTIYGGYSSRTKNFDNIKSGGLSTYDCCKAKSSKSRRYSTINVLK